MTSTFRRRAAQLVATLALAGTTLGLSAVAASAAPGATYDVPAAGLPLSVSCVVNQQGVTYTATGGTIHMVNQMHVDATGVQHMTGTISLQNVTATADPGLRKDAQAVLEIFGLPALRTEVDQTGNPAPVGQKVTYTVKVTNQGTLPASDIDVSAIVPAEMKLTDAKGPTQPDVKGQVVSFPKAAPLAPGQTMAYTIEVQAIKTGDVRFRVEMRSPILESGPIVEEPGTRIYDASVSPAPAAGS